MFIEDNEKPGGDWSVIDLDQTEEELELVEKDENTEDESNKEKVEAVENTEENLEEKRKEKSQKTSRAQERIRQLANEKRELRKKLEDAERELNEARKGKFNVEKNSVETLKSTYESSITSKMKEAVSALNNGDYEAYTQLQAEISELTLKKAALSSWQGKEPEDVKLVTEDLSKDEDVDDDSLEARLAKSNIPEEGIKWIKGNPRFMTDNSFRLHSLAINDELMAEGFDPSDKDFYDELDKRLEALGKKSTSSKKSVKSDGPTLKGSSRVTTNKKTISYTKEDVEIANRLGIPLKSYLLSKQATESKDSGWARVL